MEDHESPKYSLTIKEFCALLEPTMEDFRALLETDEEEPQSSKVVSGLQATLFPVC